MNETCSICGCKTHETTHLSLYVFGSEGINVCLTCRIALTKLAQGLSEVASKARKDGYLKQKQNTKEIK